MVNLKRSALIILGCIAIAPIFAASGTVKARQTDTEVWYWANNDSQIIAFTPDGQSQVIYEAVGAFVDSRLEGLRLSSDRAWLLDNYNQDFPPLLDSHAALTLTDSCEYPQVYVHPYLVIGQCGAYRSFVYNIDTQGIRYLADLITSQKPRFLADGHTLRYYSVKETSAPEWDEGTLWELDLTTGQETALLQVPFWIRNFYATNDGEQWWFPKVLFDGSYETVITFGPTNPRITELFKNGEGYFSFNHFIVLESPGRYYFIKLYPLSGADPLTYYVPAIRPSPVYLYADDRLVAWDEYDKLWLLDPLGGAKLLGVGPIPMTDDIGFRYGGDGYVSSDGHWLISRSMTGRDNNLYQLWDMERNVIVLEEPVEDFLVAQYTVDRVLLRKRDDSMNQSGEQGILYLAEEQRTIYLPDAPTGRWWDILPDGRLLYEEEPTSEIRTPGIYTYDIEDEAFTPLLLNVRYIWLRRDFDR